jgi:hypothetical protein
VTKHVRIAGDGVAARCCAHLLTQAGHDVRLEPVKRARVPAIMIGEAAQRLIVDIFEQDKLFRELPRIEKRIVAWGPGAKPVALDHSAVLVSEELLLDRLDAVSSGTGEPEWSVYSAAPLPGSSEEHRFGSRMASVMPVELSARARANACWIESLEQGWLFLIPGWLVAVGAPAEELLSESKLVAEQIGRRETASARFAASPRMVTPLGGEKWIACGSAAIGFDPLCGDGTAHAMREAILATAVIRAAGAGEDVGSLMAHYEARLTAGLERHLIQCRQFYSSGGEGEWWRAETEACERGIEWCRPRLGRGFRYRLNGLELERV